MRFVCLLENVHPNAFLKCTFTNQAKIQIAFVTDTKLRPGYTEANEEAIQFAEIQMNEPWLDLREEAKKQVKQWCREGIKTLTKVDDYQEWLKWNMLVGAAKDHQQLRFKNSEAPLEIKTYATANGLTPSAASRSILAKAKDLELRLNNILQLELISATKLDNPSFSYEDIESELIKIKEDLDRTVNFLE